MRRFCIRECFNHKALPCATATTWGARTPAIHARGGFAASGTLHGRVAFLPYGTLTLRGTKPQPYKDNPESLGEHLRKRRLELGLYQKDVALRLGISPWTYLSWEGDRKRPMVSMLPRLIAFLGYDPNPQPSTLGEEIAARRRQLGLSQERFADLVGLDESTIARLEAGRAVPARQTLSKLQRTALPLS